MFKKVLIANRGEIALRILRACREMGIQTVAVHSTTDQNAMHVRLADESVCIGPAPAAASYLNQSAILSAAIITNADAIHPGYGFLSENPDFVEKIEEHGLTFIGPKSKHIRMMGDKVAAKEAAIRAGLPVAAGSKGALKDLDDAIETAKKIGFPVLIKAAFGGGGKGIKPVLKPEDLKEAYQMAKSEAKASFGNDTLYMEKYLQEPKHIEVQILADNHGNVVHLGERDCSLQRNKQKVLEEAPSPLLSEKERHRIGEVAVKAIKKLGYQNAGTIEFFV